MRINLSSRELRSALAPLTIATTGLLLRWDAERKRRPLGLLRAFTDTAAELADELECADHDHERALRLARAMFDAGMELVAVIDAELRTARDRTDLRTARGAALSFMETLVAYLAPVARPATRAAA